MKELTIKAKKLTKTNKKTITLTFLGIFQEANRLTDGLKAAVRIKATKTMAQIDLV